MNIVLYPTLSDTLAKAGLACQKCNETYNQVKPSQLNCIHNICIDCLTNLYCPMCPPENRTIGMGNVSKSLQVKEITSLWEEKFKSSPNAQSSRTAVSSCSSTDSAQENVTKRIKLMDASEQSTRPSTSTAQGSFFARELSGVGYECRSFFEQHLDNISRFMCWDNRDNIQNDFNRAPHHFVFFKNLQEKRIVGFAQIKGSPGKYRVTLGVTDAQSLEGATLELLKYLRNKYYQLDSQTDSFVFRFNRLFPLASEFKRIVSAAQVKAMFAGNNDKNSVFCHEVYPLRSESGIFHIVSAPFEEERPAPASPTSLTRPVSDVQKALQDECRSYFENNLLVISVTMNWDSQLTQTIKNDFNQHPEKFIFLRNVTEGLCGFAHIECGPRGNRIVLGLPSCNRMYDLINVTLDYLKDKYCDLPPDQAVFAFSFHSSRHPYVVSLQCMFEDSGIKAEFLEDAVTLLLVLHPLKNRNKVPHMVVNPFLTESKIEVDVPERYAIVDPAKVHSGKLLPNVMVIASVTKIKDPRNCFMMSVDDTVIGFIQVSQELDYAYRLSMYEKDSSFKHFTDHFFNEFFNWFFTETRKVLIVKQVLEKTFEKQAARLGLNIKKEIELSISR